AGFVRRGPFAEGVDDLAFAQPLQSILFEYLCRAAAGTVDQGESDEVKIAFPQAGKINKTPEYRHQQTVQTYMVRQRDMRRKVAMPDDRRQRLDIGTA